MQISPHLIASSSFVRRTLRRLSASAVLVASCALALSAAPASAAGCDYVVAPSGSDQAAGTADAPFATVQHLVDQLSAGQTGCVRAGTYNEDVTFSHGGSAGSPITLTSYPGDAHATIIGRMWVPSGSDYVTVSDFNLDGVNSEDLPSPTVDDTGASFLNNDITNHHTAICFDLGDDTGQYGTAHDTLIQDNRIHHCGVMPAKNHDHGIYVEEAVDTQILGNVIYDNADRGVQLYPDSQGTVIKGNVIDSNGEGVIFSGDFGRASSNNTVENNIITNSNVRNNVESWYPSGNPAGHANIVTNNCIEGGVRGSADGGVDTSGGGFTATGNLNANPDYANPSAGDYAVSASSPCAAVLAGSPVPPPSSTPPPTSTPPPAKKTGGSPPPKKKTGGAAGKQHHHTLTGPTVHVLGRLTLIARVSPRDRRLLVHGHLAPALLNHTREIVVLTRIGHHWRVAGVRWLSQRTTFNLSLRLGHTSVHGGIQVRARVVRSTVMRTIMARVA